MRNLFLTMMLLSLPIEAAQLQLKQQIFRGKLPVTVGDVFAVKGKDAEAISQLPVSWANPNGWNGAGDLLKNVKATEFKYKLGEVDKVFLALCQEVDMALLKSNVEKALKARLDGQKVRLSRLGLLSNKAPCITPGVEVVQSKVNFNGRLSKRVQSSHTLSNGNSISVWWQTDFSVYAGMANSLISKQSQLTEAAITYGWNDLGNVRADKLLAPQQLPSHRAKKQIRPGQLIGLHNSELIPDVEQGEQVRLILINQGITIESAAKALDSGRVNDVILVLADRATAPVKVTIADKGVVYAHN